MRLQFANGWTGELALAALALVVGFGLMPLFIFAAGASLLGRYEGASVSGIYASLYRGLETGSVASWIVALGPYGLYLSYRVLRMGWDLSFSATGR